MLFALSCLILNILLGLWLHLHGRLDNVLPNVHVLILRTWEYVTLQKGPCRCDSGKHFEMGV